MIVWVVILLVVVGCIAYAAWTAYEAYEQMERERQLAEHQARCQRLVRDHQARIRADRARLQAEMHRALEAYQRDQRSR